MNYKKLQRGEPVTLEMPIPAGSMAVVSCNACDLAGGRSGRTIERALERVRPDTAQAGEPLA